MLPDEQIILMDEDGYVVRTYKEGDEKAFISLFNSVYKDFAGFVPRTPEYWRWCCIARPDVEKNGIIVIEKEAEIIGYVVVGKSGNIWELCYNPAYVSKTVVLKLLKWAIRYLEKVGGNSVTLNVPANDHVLIEVCEELGFVESLPPTMFISILDFQRFIAEVLHDRSKMLRKFNGAVSIRLRNCPDWCNETILLRIKDGNVSVKGENTDKAEFLVETDIQTITSCILGTTSCMKAIFSSRLKIRPFWKIRKFLRLISLLRIRDSWFSPSADFG